jgi:hypothetical protein
LRFDSGWLVCAVELVKGLGRSPMGKSHLRSGSAFAVEKST